MIYATSGNQKGEICSSYRSGRDLDGSHPGVKLQSFPSHAEHQRSGIPHIPRAAFQLSLRILQAHMGGDSSVLLQVSIHELCWFLLSHQTMWPHLVDADPDLLSPGPVRATGALVQERPGAQ